MAVAGAALWWVGVPGASAGTVPPDVGSLALMPPQVTALFGADIDGLRASTLYGAWHQRAEQKLRDREYTDFVARTGFDPERDLAGVTAAVWQIGDQPAFLAVVTARYNRFSLSTFLREMGSPSDNYRGFELFNSPGARHNPAALALMDDHIILAGTATAVKQALDLKLQPGPNALGNTALIERVRKIGAENQVWAVSSAPGAFLPAHVPPGGQANALRVLQGMESSTFGLNATSGLRLLMEGTCASEDDARTLADAAQGLLAMARLAAPTDRPQALELLNAFQIEQQQRQVRVTAEISQPLLDQFAENPNLFLPHGGYKAHGERKN